MPVAQACFVVMKVCEGLDYAHNKRDQAGRELSLVHRDVSPQNILVSFEGEVKLIDFGIAKAAGKGTKTQAGILKGKFGYMSPEQVRGLPVDRRSDVFSCGIVLYELLTGERLFVGESDFSTLEKVRNVEILPPSTYNRKIPDELERIVLKALAKDVEDRYQNAIDLHDELQAFVYTAGEFYSRKDLAGVDEEDVRQGDRGGDGEARELSPAQAAAGRRARRAPRGIASRRRPRRAPPARKSTSAMPIAQVVPSRRRRRRDDRSDGSRTDAGQMAAPTAPPPIAAQRAASVGEEARIRPISRGTTTSSRPRSTTTPRTIRRTRPRSRARRAAARAPPTTPSPMVAAPGDPAACRRGPSAGRPGSVVARVDARRAGRRGRASRRRRPGGDAQRHRHDHRFQRRARSSRPARTRSYRRSSRASLRLASVGDDRRASIGAGRVRLPRSTEPREIGRVAAPRRRGAELAVRPDGVVRREHRRAARNRQQRDFLLIAGRRRRDRRGRRDPRDRAVGGKKPAAPTRSRRPPTGRHRRRPIRSRPRRRRPPRRRSEHRLRSLRHAGRRHEVEARRRGRAPIACRRGSAASRRARTRSQIDAAAGLPVSQAASRSPSSSARRRRSRSRCRRSQDITGEFESTPPGANGLADRRRQAPGARRRRPRRRRSIRA